MQKFPQQFQTPLSQKKRDFIWIFYFISEVCIKKKDDYPRLIISEIIDTEKRGYLNV